MAVGTLWYAQMAKAYVSPNLTISLTGTSTGTASPIYALLSSTVNYTGRVSNLTIRGGTRDMTPVNTLGISQLQHLQRPEVVSAEFTLIYDNAQSAQYIAGAAVTTFSFTGTQANTGTYVRYQFGEKSSVTTGAGGDRQLMSVCFVLDNMATSTDNKTVYVSLTNAVMTTPPEISLSADGYVEEKWTIKCLAQDYYVEANFTSF